MSITCGTFITENMDFKDIEWTWEGLDHLIVGSINNERMVQFSYEELEGLAGYFEKINAERLKEFHLLND